MFRFNRKLRFLQNWEVLLLTLTCGEKGESGVIPPSKVSAKAINEKFTATGILPISKGAYSIIEHFYRVKYQTTFLLG